MNEWQQERKKARWWLLLFTTYVDTDRYSIAAFIRVVVVDDVKQTQIGESTHIPCRQTRWKRKQMLHLFNFLYKQAHTTMCISELLVLVTSIEAPRRTTTTYKSVLLFHVQNCSCCCCCVVVADCVRSFYIPLSLSFPFHFPLFALISTIATRLLFKEPWLD